MKVKTFVVGLVDGVVPSLTRLDECVAELGNVVIHSLVDTVYSADSNSLGRPPGERIARVIVYTPESR